MYHFNGKFLEEFQKQKVKNIFFGVPAEKAGGHFVAIFFSDKNLKKGFSLLSLTLLELIMNNPKSTLKSLTVMGATE